MGIEATQHLNGKVTESSAADNALATATVAAVGNVRHFIKGFGISWSAAPAAAYKVLQIKFGTTVVANIIFDPLKDGPSGCEITLPAHIHGDFNQAVSAELSASGTGGVTGRVSLYTYSN